MARAAVKAKQQARAKAQPAKTQRGRRRHAGGGNPNEQLFFTRLRRRQKWVFLALAVVFAATFAGVGVGSGNGAGLDQLFNGILGGGGTSVSKAKDEIKTNPIKGYQDLADAYLQQSPADTADAITAYQSYLRIKKDDANTWLKLASLQSQQAGTYIAQYQQAQQQAALANPAQAVQPTGPLGSQLGTNPVDEYYSQQASTTSSQFAQLATSGLNSALTSYQMVAKLQPRNASVQLQVANVASQLQQKSLALKAYQRYVELNPHSPNLGQVEKLCQGLGGICTPAYLKAQHHHKK